jgi:hypothetical protein
MNENFCECLEAWLWRKKKVVLKSEFKEALNNKNIEIVSILKEEPEWLADKFCKLCSKNGVENYDDEISDIVLSFRDYQLSKVNE